MENLIKLLNSPVKHFISPLFSLVIMIVGLSYTFGKFSAKVEDLKERLKDVTLSLNEAKQDQAYIKGYRDGNNNHQNRDHKV